MAEIHCDARSPIQTEQSIILLADFLNHATKAYKLIQGRLPDFLINAAYRLQKASTRAWERPPATPSRPESSRPSAYELCDISHMSIAKRTSGLRCTDRASANQIMWMGSGAKSFKKIMQEINENAINMKCHASATASATLILAGSFFISKIPSASCFNRL